MFVFIGCAQYYLHAGWLFNVPRLRNKFTVVRSRILFFISHVLYIALQQESHKYIPRKENARPQSQFPHSCVCERFIYSQDRPTYFPAAK
jgi:hypothetical protein